MIVPFPRTSSRGFIGILLIPMALGTMATVIGQQVQDTEVWQALPEGQPPLDARLGPLNDLNGYFPFFPPRTKEQWERRAAEVRHRMLVALGLWPMPSRQPLNPVIHGKMDRGDYTVEKVYFESMPGFYVTGNLYRPKGVTGKRPGILCPHGHWSRGRFYDLGPEKIKDEIAKGAERFEEGGRSPLQARCVQLARMGCVVFHYDMIGYADSRQIPLEIAHRFARQRPDMIDPENWGLFSPQAESHFQSVMGLQAFNSIRALDFLQSLPDVQSDRVAVTGASGGGTQTFILSAIDPRPVVSFPAVMVSTAMQGGCTCENACDLRIGTGNVEFAALFAPKPLGLTAANDWTKEMETKGFPELKQLYTLLGAADHVSLTARLEFGHNYNYVSRSAMYHWMNRHLDLGLAEPIEERDYTRLTEQEMTVWDDEHPVPAGGPEFERKLLSWWHDDTQKQLAAMTPRDEVSWKKYHQFVKTAMDVIVGRRLPSKDQVPFTETRRAEHDRYAEVIGLLHYSPGQEQLPAVVLKPVESTGPTVVWIDRQGKQGLRQPDGQLKPSVRRLLDAGWTVLGVDLIYQGELSPDGKPLTQARRVKNEREAAAYTFGYNHTVFAQRTHDVLTAIAYGRHELASGEPVVLVALNGAGPWAAAARAQAPDAIRCAAIDTAGFRFIDVNDIYSPDFLPGGAKYGDLPGMLALAAPGPLWLAGEGDAMPEVTAAAYRATGAEESVTLDTLSSETAEQRAVDWLLTKTGN